VATTREGTKTSREAFYNRSAATPSNAIEVPRLELPKGGGALKGIDEKFTVNAVNGTTSLALPLPLTHAHATPTVSLSYDSGNGNGAFGIGWSLDFASVQRRTDKQLPRYLDGDESDVFLLSGAEDLVPFLRDDGTTWETTDGDLRIKRYRPRVESSFALIERIWRDGEDSFYWKVTAGNNSVTFYGLSPQSRVCDPQNPRKVFRWLPELAFDDKGNVVCYHYKSEDGVPGAAALHDQNRYDDLGQPRFANRHLKRICYGNREPWYPASIHDPPIPLNLTFAFEAVFDYGEHGAPLAPGDTQATIYTEEQQPWPARTDAHSNYRAGFEIRTLRLCRRILMFHAFDELGATPCLVRSLDLDYASSLPGTAQFAEVTYLVAATLRGYSRRSGELYDVTSLPPQSYSYQPLQWQTSVQELSSADVMNAPEGLADSYQWVDLWSEGVSGILTEQGGALHYKSNLGDGRFTAALALAAKPSFSGIGKGGLSLQDLDADGGRQLVARTPGAKGFFELDARDGWQPFTAFAKMPNVDLAAPNVLHLDLDGDGRADLLVTEECIVRWYPSAGRDGYGDAENAPKARDENQGPVLLWNDPLQRIFLADLSGDGLSDIVRIRNGEVCYWPNLGYGRFGNKVTMDHAPQFAASEQFDPRYLHLADVTGTGASDILYLDGRQALVWLNLSGNAWSAPLTIALPETVLPNRFSAVDLLGHGTACLVWSSPLPANQYSPLRYVDLLGGKKPHLLMGLSNGVGKETTLTYRSSTQFYLDDRRARTPWKTKLPFPVQCLSRVETREQVTNTLLVQEYSYHHGYYDHAEREFRGFGRVDRTDTESFSRWVRQDASNVVDEGFHQPVVLTRSWYHTGAPPDGGDPLALFQADYWHQNPALLSIPGVQPPSEPALPPASLLPTGFSADELREAFRACKGMMLRQEVFALDAPAQGATDAQRIAELTPYSVALHNCYVNRRQPRGDNRHAVFLVHESEALTLAYERRPADARIAHTLHLEIDDYGQVSKSVAVVYGRELGAPPADVPAEAWQAQEQLHLVLTERSVTDDDFTSGTAPYRLPVECETKTFELTGIVPPGGTPLFDLQALRAACLSAVETGFEFVAPPDGQPRKRLVQHTRVLHLAPDLAAPLAFRKASPLGLAFQSYQLALTQPVLRQLFPVDKIADPDIEPMLGGEGKYVHFDDLHGTSDAHWWIPSGTVDFLDAQKAPQRFYQPAGYVDARGAKTTVSYAGEDATRVNATAHWQLLATIQDPVGNQAEMLGFDFRVLAPLKLQDINGNFSEVVIDDLGRVIASAIMGKGADADSLDALKVLLADRPTQAQLTQQFLAQADLADATSLLADATTRWVYDDTAIPMRAASISRERHVQDLAQSGDPLALRLAFEYLGGACNVVMQKVRAPGNRWLGTGRTVLNNKGYPVKQYEPYFSPNHLYETDKDLTDTGVSPLLTYDSIGRHVRTDHPDGSYEFTRFDSWSQQIFDQNDTVLSSQWYASRMALAVDDPRRLAAEQTEMHDGTPLTIFLDSLARQMCSVAHNRGRDGGGVVQESFPRITASLDVEGNVLAVKDARGNLVTQGEYDMLGRALHQSSTDAGERWTLPDAAGATLYHWDSRGHRLHHVYDPLHRLVEERLSTDGAAEVLVAQKLWGELAPNAQSVNLRGKLWKSYDPSGLFESVEHDFKGNRLESRRRFTTTYDQTIEWPAVDPDSLLDQETFRTRALYDALNRPTNLFSPDTPVIPATEVVLGYDDGARLAQVSAKLRGAATATSFVDGIGYNEKGQRLFINYGNGVSTQYHYEPDTFRLDRLTTTRNAGPVLQDLRYVYDPVGNITSQSDDAQEATYFNGIVTSPGGSYEYDALYRLTRALGREQIGQNAPPSEWDAERTGQILPGDAQAMQPYDQRYEYDLVGNIVTMIHNASSGGQFVNRWTRVYSYEAASNRLSSTQIGNTTVSYSYNPHGSMLTMPHLQQMDWDFAEHLQHIRQGTTDAHYNYDDTGQRTRKVVDKQGGLQEVRLYLGPFEVFRRYQDGALVLERETQHIMDDLRRIALVDTRTVGDDGSAGQLIRYQLANHLGSAAVETDGQGDVITYEEYHPYGTTSWQAGRTLAEVSLKRYRYSGLERDEESGFGHHGARYYAPWIGRWTAADPAGLVDGPNVYAYSTDNPVVLHDPNGMQTGKPNETDHVIMQMTDPELHKFLSSLSPELQSAFAAGATGAFAQRAAKMVSRYNLQSVEITSKTRTIGDVAQYSKQGKANYLDILGSKRRADEAEHALATAGAKHILQEATDKWKRESPTIVLAEAQSRIKTPTDNQLTRDLKAGRISAEEWLRASKTNAYRSWFEARAQGVKVPTAEEMAHGILEQERALKLRIIQKQLDRLDQIQRQAAADQAYGPVNNVTRFQGQVSTRLDQTAEAQAHGQVRTQFFVGLGGTMAGAAAHLGIVYGGVMVAGAGTATTVGTSSATTAPQAATTGLRIVSGLRFATPVVESAPTLLRIGAVTAEAVEAEATGEVLAEEAARTGVRIVLSVH
jgi:RHS repeat-associated protein